MRTEPEQYIALECLRLACGQPSVPDTTELAGEFYAFVTGSGLDEAETKLAAVRAVVS